MVSCSLCTEIMDRDILDVHKGKNCRQRIATCEFCEFPLPASDLLEHQEVCGNRTELCNLCNKYIRLQESHNHEIRCTGFVNNNAESSRLMIDEYSFEEYRSFKSVVSRLRRIAVFNQASRQQEDYSNSAYDKYYSE
ncbi:hypothetical protein OROHE_001066 [Orobanche hederae]